MLHIEVSISISIDVNTAISINISISVNTSINKLLKDRVKYCKIGVNKCKY